MQDLSSLIVQLRKESTSHDSCVLALECTKENLLKELEELISQLGFVHYNYSVLCHDLFCKTKTNPHSAWSSTFDCLGNLPEKVIQSYGEEVSNIDPLWQKLPGSSSLLLGCREGELTGPVDSFWAEQGIFSRVYIPMPAKSDRFWFNYFGLYHSEPVDQLEPHFKTLEGWLVPVLQRYHALLQVVCDQPFNTRIKQGPFSSTCVDILTMTAQGMPVKSIADTLALTEEGVTYHITRAKKVFKARNKTQLIAMLYESGIL